MTMSANNTKARSGHWRLDPPDRRVCVDTGLSPPKFNLDSSPHAAVYLRRLRKVLAWGFHNRICYDIATGAYMPGTVL